MPAVLAIVPSCDACDAPPRAFTKRCPKCDRRLCERHYSRDDRYGDGLNPTCTACRAAMNRERRQSKRAMLEQPDTITLRAREKLVIEQRELISKVLSEVRHAGGDGVTLRSLTRQHHVSASEVLSVLVLLASLDLVDLRFAHGRARNGSATKHRWIATAVEPFGRELGYVELPVIPLPLDLAAFWVPALQRDRETVASASTALEHARSQRNTNHPNYAAIAHFQRQLDVAPALAALATEHLARMPYGKFDPDAYNANFEAPHSLSQ